MPKRMRGTSKTVRSVHTEQTYDHTVHTERTYTCPLSSHCVDTCLCSNHALDVGYVSWLHILIPRGYTYQEMCYYQIYSYHAEGTCRYGKGVEEREYFIVLPGRRSSSECGEQLALTHCFNCCTFFVLLSTGIINLTSRSPITPVRVLRKLMWRRVSHPRFSSHLITCLLSLVYKTRLSYVFLLWEHCQRQLSGVFGDDLHGHKEKLAIVLACMFFDVSSYLQTLKFRILSD